MVALARMTTSSSVVNFNDGHDGAKDLFFGNSHIIGYIGGNGRLDKVSFGTMAISSNRTVCSFGLSFLNVS
jgi:hypothetical protein